MGELNVGKKCIKIDLIYQLVKCFLEFLKLNGTYSNSMLNNVENTSVPLYVVW